MAITRYHPTPDPLGSLLEGITAPWWGGGTAGMQPMLRAPQADVIERENEIRVEVEMPGLRPEDVEVSLEGSLLTINGEKREERTEGDEGSTWHLSERRYGRFSRSFLLPRDVEQDQIQADFEHGVLRVTIPKSERARRRRIEIRGGNGSAQQRRVEADTARTQQ